MKADTLTQKSPTADVDLSGEELLEDMTLKLNKVVMVACSHGKAQHLGLIEGHHGCHKRGVLLTMYNYYRKLGINTPQENEQSLIS